MQLFKPRCSERCPNDLAEKGP